MKSLELSEDRHVGDWSSALSLHCRRAGRATALWSEARLAESRKREDGRGVGVSNAATAVRTFGGGEDQASGACEFGGSLVPTI